MKRFVTFAVLGAAVLVGTASVGFAEIKTGQEMVVTANNARLMLGNSTVATLPAGSGFTSFGPRERGLARAWPSTAAT